MPKLPRNKIPASTKPPKLPDNKETNQDTNNTQQQQQLRTASGLDPEAEDQFELELCWCIQQLEAGLTNDKKLQDKQIYNMTKSLNVLKSGNASLIKKRQVMRNTFGDYRLKMASDEKKFAKSVAAVKFAPVNKKVDKKSVFLKKARCVEIDKNEEDGKIKCIDEQLDEKLTIKTDVVKEPFRFNFTINES